MLALVALSYWVISKEAAASRYGYKYQPQDSLSAPGYSPEGGGIWTTIFAYYCLVIHVLVFAFPLRLCWSVWDMTASLKKTARSKTLKDFKFAHRRRLSSTSLSSSETLTSSHASSSASSEAGDVEPEFYNDADLATDRVIHAIVLPNYKEEMDTLRETLDVLASHPQARNCYDVSFLLRRRAGARLPSYRIARRRAMAITPSPATITRRGRWSRSRRPIPRLTTPIRRSTSPWSNARTTPRSRPCRSWPSSSRSSAPSTSRCTRPTSRASRPARAATSPGPPASSARSTR